MRGIGQRGSARIARPLIRICSPVLVVSGENSAPLCMCVYVDMCGHIQMYVDVFGCMWMVSDVFGCMCVYSDVCARVCARGEQRKRERCGAPSADPFLFE